MTNPVPGYRVTTGYKKPGGWSAGYHTGVDHAAPSGAKVVAIKSGRVIHVGWGGWGQAYGAHVIIQHGNYQTMVAHLSRTTVRVGQNVREGQQIGNVGTTGNSTGPHGHVETRTSPYRYNNRIVNPQGFYGSSSSGGGGGGKHVYVSKLKYGQRSSDSVKHLQRRLAELGHRIPDGATGNYFSQTDDAVRAWQRKIGDRVDPKGRSSIGPRQAKVLFGSGYTIH